MWNASRFCVSSLRRGHANLLCIVPILVYVLPKQVQPRTPKMTIQPTNMVCSVPLAQWIARWTSNPKVLGSTPRWDDRFLHFVQFFYLGIIDQLSEVYGFHSVAVITCASHAQGRRFEPGWKHQNFASSTTLIYHTHGGQAHKEVRSYGVMVSTLDFESSDPSSNLGRT